MKIDTNLFGFILIEVKLQEVIFFIESVLPFIKFILASSPFSSQMYSIYSFLGFQQILVISFLLKIIFCGSFCERITLTHLFKIDLLWIYLLDIHHKLVLYYQIVKQ